MNSFDSGTGLGVCALDLSCPFEIRGFGVICCLRRHQLTCKLDSGSIQLVLRMSLAILSLSWWLLVVFHVRRSFH